MITDAEARNIANQWHGGGGTALYAFASTGAINTARADHDLSREISGNLRHVKERPNVYGALDMDNLLTLLDYVLANEPRAAVAGWSALPLDPRPQEHPR